ncbi:MAG: DUF885 domain-containing protein [Halioglobus sp.]
MQFSTAHPGDSVHIKGLIGALFVALNAISLIALAGPSAERTAELHAWLDDAYLSELMLKPQTLTSLGRKEAYERVNDVSEAGERQIVELMAKSVGDMEQRFDPALLDSAGRASYDFWKFRADQQRTQLDFATQRYYLDHKSGNHTRPVNFMVNYHAVDTEKDMVDYIARLQGFSSQLGQYLERARSSAKQGVRPPRFSYEIVIKESKEIVSGQPFQAVNSNSAVWSDVLLKTRLLEEAGTITTERGEELRESARKVLVEQFLPAYNDLISWVKQDISKTSEDAQGVSSLPNGAAYYQARLARYTQSRLTADEVHEIGLREVERIHAEMKTVMAQLSFDGDLQDFMTFVRTDEKFYYPSTQEGREAYLADSKRVLNDINQRLPMAFGTLPHTSLVVRRVEPYKERIGGSAFYQKGATDGSRPGRYYLHMADMRALNRARLEALAYHEGNPGHHMQLSIALESDGLPLFRRSEGYSAYKEGWALYAELLGKELGGYADPYSDYGRLNSEIFRALRLVVDTGLHAKGWSQEQAVQYMLANASFPETKIRSEVRRYLANPGQATSYKIGMIRIQQMRARAEKAQGEAFDLGAFHDLVLGGGALPLPVLDRVVDDWITQQE